MIKVLLSASLDLHSIAESYTVPRGVVPEVSRMGKLRVAVQPVRKALDAQSTRTYGQTYTRLVVLHRYGTERAMRFAPSAVFIGYAGYQGSIAAI